MKPTIAIIGSGPAIPERLAAAGLYAAYEMRMFERELPVDTLVEQIQDSFSGIPDGIFGRGDIGSLKAAIVARRLGLDGEGVPSVAAVLACQHKLLSRRAQRLSIPESTPRVWHIDLSEPESELLLPDDLVFPLISKPYCSNFSRLTAVHYSRDELVQWLEENGDRIEQQGELYKKRIHEADPEVSVTGVVLEGLETGMQATIDGWMLNGRAEVHGVVDSIFLPETLSFSRFEYPSVLSEQVQERARVVVEKFLNGIGYSSGSFNMEFFYDAATDRLAVIEFNSRAASQFHPLYEAIHDYHAIEVDVRLSLGEDPRSVISGRTVREGVAVIHILRRTENARVVGVPSVDEAGLFSPKYPDAHLNLYVHAGETLRDIVQDEDTFRYGDVYFFVDRRVEIEGHIEALESEISFEFGPIEES